jgi:hypothetical protein
MPMDCDQAAEALFSGSLGGVSCDAQKDAGADLHRETPRPSAVDAAPGNHQATLD